MFSSSFPPMQAEVIRRQTLLHLPSASGIEVAANKLCVIGDDSPWLYVLDQQWNTIGKVALFTPEGILPEDNIGPHAPEIRANRIPKKLKPDLEMLTKLQIGPEEMLLVAGSGAESPQRDVAFLVRPDESLSVTALSLTPLYNQLRAMPEVVGQGRLNLEGLAADHEWVFFLQRGNVSGLNVLIRYDRLSFTAYLSGQSDQLPMPQVHRYELPSIAGIRSGFSGATLLTISHGSGSEEGMRGSGGEIGLPPAVLLFTASVENTADEILDGETLGSLVGFLNPDQPEQLLSWAWITEKGQPYTGKVESIAVLEEPSESGLFAIAVTDNDFGDSEILELRLSW
jgi:hypothetical protein